MIAVNNVVAGYTRDVDILRGISITAKELEIVTILGPNGCGKSTLLKTVAGFLLPREGTVTLDERNIGQVPVFKTSVRNKVFGPGHNSFTVDEKGRDMLVYHGRDYAEIKGDPLFDPNRHTRVQPFGYDRDGAPHFGEPVANGPLA